MTSTASLDDLIALGRYRWTPLLLADLAAHKGGRFVELLNRLNVSRDSLARTIESAINAGWVVRNPGYGHPLRPEYILTAQGQNLAQTASNLIAARDALHIPQLKLTRWSIPVIRIVADGHQRFNDVSRILSDAGPRSISQSLRTLAANDLLVRKLVDQFPPFTLYQLTERGTILAQAI